MATRQVCQRLTVKAARYADEVCPRGDNTLETLEILEKRIAEYTEKYQDVVSQAANVQPLLIEPVIPTNRVNLSDDDDHNKSRNAFIDTFSGEELSCAVTDIATSKYYSTCLNDDLGGTSNKSSLTEKEKGETSFPPPVEERYNVYVQLHKENKESLEVIKQARDPNGIYNIVVVPSQWMMDFLSVFVYAETIHVPGYPEPRQIEGVFYDTLQSDNMTTGSFSCKTYRLDIDYHCSRFGTLFTNTPFASMKEEQFPSFYTDFELLAHFAMRRTNHYERFLSNPYEYLAGDHLETCVSAIENAAHLILKSSRHSFFKTTSKGLQVYTMTTNGEGKAIHVSVPGPILSCLVEDIVENISRYKSKQAMLSILGSDITVLSPIGRLLNLDSNAVGEFENLYRKHNPTEPEKVNGRVAEEVGKMSCVAKVYQMLVCASATMFAMRMEGHEMNVKLVIDKCTHWDHENLRVNYASTAEAFPGLLFYIMLTARSAEGAFKTEGPHSVTDLPRPGMALTRFFHERSQCTAFFNTFGSYAFRLRMMMMKPPQDDKQVLQLVNMDSLNEVRISAKKSLQEARDAYASFLGFYAHPDNSHHWLSDRKVMNYFKGVGDGRNSSYQLLRNIDYDSFYQFCLRPVKYWVTLT